MVIRDISCGFVDRIREMRTLFHNVLVLVMLALLLAACSKSVENQGSGSQGSQITSESVVLFAAEPVEIAANSSTEAIVHVMVKEGYHLNANPPTYPYLKATELELSSTEGLTVGFITYPNPMVKKFPFADKPLAVYEGDIQLRIMLKAAASATKGSSNLLGKLKVQACDDQVCYVPGEVSIAIPVTVK